MKTPSESLLVVVLVGGWEETADRGASAEDGGGSAFPGLPRCCLLAALDGPSAVLNASPGSGARVCERLQEITVWEPPFFCLAQKN